MKEYDYEDESFEIHTGMKSPFEDIEVPKEQMPEEYRERKTLEEELSKLAPDSVHYLNFLQSLKKLNEEIRELTTPTKDGWPILDQLRKESLMKLYMETGENLQQFLKETAGQKPANESSEINTNRNDEIKTNEINTNRNDNIIETRTSRNDEINTDRNDNIIEIRTSRNDEINTDRNDNIIEIRTSRKDEIKTSEIDDIIEIKTNEIKTNEIKEKDEPVGKAQETLAARKIARQLGNLIVSDYRALQRCDPKSEKTFLSVLDDSRTKVYEYPTYKKINTTRGGMSVRYELQTEGPDGKMIRGYFAEKENYDVISSLEKVGPQVAKKAANPQGAVMIRDFLKNYMEHYADKAYADKEHPTDRNQFETWYQFFSNLGEEKFADTQKNKLVAEMAAVYGLRAKDITTMCGSQALDLMVRKISKIKDTFMLTSAMNIPVGARKDTRNSAMSTVAGLLGVQDLVVYSRPMKIRKADGTMIEGTFMAEADGFDPNRPGQDIRRLVKQAGRERAMTGGGGDFLKQIADLQALDFICGNGDRHAANLFIQIDQYGHFVGVQGIDNDLSFGLNGKDFKNNKREMVVPKNMGVISKSMADRILQLKPEHLEFALRGQVEAITIQGATQRLKKMQNTIINSREKLSKDPKEIRYPYIRELADEEWDTIDPEKLYKDEKHENLFSKVWKDIPQLGYRFDNPAGENEMATIGTTNRAEFAGVSQVVRETKAQEELLRKAVEKSKYATEDYRKLQEAMTNYREKAEKIYNRILNARKNYTKRGGRVKDVEMIVNRYVSRADLADMKTAAAKVREAAKTYYERAGAEVRNRGGKAKDITRMEKMKAATKNIYKAMKDHAEIREEEYKMLQKNQRRQTEDMMKHLKQNPQNKGRGPVL